MTCSSIFIDKTDGHSLKPNFEEVFRYMGYALRDRKNPEDSVRPVVENVVSAFQNLIAPQSVYVCFPLRIENETLIFGQENCEYKIVSKQLSRFLSECSFVILFAATLGPKIDREIQKNQKLEPSKAVVMQATGAMYIEEYCDCLCKKFKDMAEEEGMTVRPRFSPGFGDVPLEVQKMFFKILDCKKIGLTLMDTLIMAPEKSVTAFVGVKKISGEKNA